MVRHATSSPGAVSNSSYASDKSEPTNALERLMAQLMNSPLTTVEHQMFDVAVGTPVRRHESFSSGGSTPPTTPPTPTSSYSSSSASKQPKPRKTKDNRGSNKGRPRLDSTSSLNKTPVRVNANKKSSPSTPFLYSTASCSGSECEERFAGARFTLPPSPDAVPLPPAAWFQN